MRLTLLRADCDTGRTCPNINITDRHTYVVQGYVVSQERAAAAGATIPAGLRAVELPLSLLPEVAEEAPRWPGFRLTGHGTVLVWGPAVTDTDVLAELALPVGETAIELPYDAMPALEAVP